MPNYYNPYNFYPVQYANQMGYSGIPMQQSAPMIPQQSPMPLALSVNGFVRPFTIAAATPAAAGDFWHVSGSTDIYVDAGCCTNVAVVNASVSATPATTPAPAVDIRNLNVTIERIAA